MVLICHSRLITDKWTVTADPKLFNGHSWSPKIFSHGWSQKMISHCWSRKIVSHGWSQKMISHGWSRKIVSHGWSRKLFSHGWSQKIISHGWSQIFCGHHVGNSGDFAKFKICCKVGFLDLGFEKPFDWYVLFFKVRSWKSFDSPGFGNSQQQTTSDFVFCWKEKSY